jgi:hypothetical protein
MGIVGRTVRESVGHRRPPVIQSFLTVCGV